MNNSEIAGVEVEKSDKGITIKLSGGLYLKLGEKFQNGEISKEFYRKLKAFVIEITKLAD
ncbi:MAG: hypothetical protein ACFFCZ_24425 [Promethearchaeota archaeon]